MNDRLPESCLTTDGVIADIMRICSAVISLPPLFSMVIMASIEVSSRNFKSPGENVS